MLDLILVVHFVGKLKNLVNWAEKGKSNKFSTLLNVQARIL